LGFALSAKSNLPILAIGRAHITLILIGAAIAGRRGLAAKQRSETPTSWS
jgi:hypothetical protein